MANQWGRDNVSGPDRAGGRFTMIVVAIVLFAMGVGGGYGAYRLAGSDNEAALVDLRTELDRLKGDNETTLAELETARAALQEARDRLTGNGATEDELRATIARQAADLDRMTGDLARADAERQTLEQRLKAAQRNAGQQSDLAAEIARLTADNRALDAERRDLAANLSTTAGELTRLNRLNQHLDARARELEAAEIQSQRNIGELRQRLADANDRIARLQRQVRELSEARPDPQRPDPPSPDPQRPDPQRPDPQRPDPQRPEPPPREPQEPQRPERPRAAAAVDAALDKAAGLDRLSVADKRQLRRLLIGGECVSTALDAVFERVPVVTMRNLIRDLKSDC